MKLLTQSILTVMTISAISCGDDGVNRDCGDGTMLVGNKCEAVVPPDGAVTGPTFVQVEHLGRPAINEALLITEAFNAGDNGTAPSFGGVPGPTLDRVKAEAKTVLKALYLGGCLLNGTIPTITAATGVHPAGAQCVEIGPAIWVENDLTTGSVLKQTVKDAAEAYAERVFLQFEPDVLRLDTAVATSTYLNVCDPVNGPNNPLPLLCGGRFLSDDTVDVTYNYLLNGANPVITTGAAATFNQVSALLSDGVAFSSNPAKNNSNTTPPDNQNRNQFHPDVSPGFPYSAAPF